jgi:hypothetical protein
MKVPFLQLYIESDKIILDMVKGDVYTSYVSWQLYLSYISSCDWTDEEFNLKLLDYIDNNWEDKVLN